MEEEVCVKRFLDPFHVKSIRDDSHASDTSQPVPGLIHEGGFISAFRFRPKDGPEFENAVLNRRRVPQDGPWRPRPTHTLYTRLSVVVTRFEFLFQML